MFTCVGPTIINGLPRDYKLGQEAQAKERISSIPASNPFTLKYETMPLETEDWES